MFFLRLLSPSEQIMWLVMLVAAVIWLVFKSIERLEDAQIARWIADAVAHADERDARRAIAKENIAVQTKVSAVPAARPNGNVVSYADPSVAVIASGGRTAAEFFDTLTQLTYDGKMVWHRLVREDFPNSTPWTNVNIDDCYAGIFNGTRVDLICNLDNYVECWVRLPSPGGCRADSNKHAELRPFYDLVSGLDYSYGT